VEKFIPISELTHKPQKPQTEAPSPETFEKYESKFKALADKKRLHILNLLCQQPSTCVCDLSELIDMPQSKLSYHLRILLDVDLIHKETKGTWSYYSVNTTEINHLLSPELCCLFRPDCC
jgi:ArsR family transcriptional regulator, arsenate/arsenite/antimonite-responsive transcriptional repressor